MEKIMVQGVELGFNDLSEEMQKKLYLQNKEMFELDVAQSIYPDNRKMIIEDRESSSSILDKLFEVETKIYKCSCMSNIELLWNHPNFEKSVQKIKLFLNSFNENIKIMIVRAETSSEFLNDMLREEVQGDNNSNVIIAIRENPNFRIEEETINVLFDSIKRENRVIAAEEETDTLKLNEMLRDEVQGYDDSDVIVIDTIRKNSNFTIEEETIKVLFDSIEWQNRVIAAEEENDTSKLNEMLKEEIQGELDNEVVDAILENDNFRIAQESIKVFFNLEDCGHRIIVAKKETDTSKLNEMLRAEIRGKNNSDVLDAIFENPHFKIEEETTKLLSEL